VEPPTVGLLGLFGVGNLGNDGSFEVGLAMVRDLTPHADAVCICPATEYISSRYGISTIKMREPRRVASWLDPERSGRPGRVLRPLAEMQRWTDTYRAARRLAVIIVPGMGILDDFGLRPQGVPYILFRWTLCARLARTPFAFVGIGAGPIKNPKSRRLMGWAARLATHRSYRDVGSQDYMADLGAPGHFTPDVVFADARLRITEPSAASSAAGERPIIGVGVMSYGGWTDRVADGEEAARAYLARIVDAVGRLLDGGSQVSLLVGAASDRATVRSVVAAVEATGRQLDGRLHTPEITSLGDLSDELRKTDGAIVTRYHNLVCALIVGRPCVPIGYETRFDELKVSIGLGAFGHDTGSFDVDQVLADLDAARVELDERSDAVVARLVEFGEMVTNDFAAVLADV
jgi:polysaccharide pyruvyl transferase WcaK-like protein